MVKYVWLLLSGMWLSVPTQAQNERVYKGLISQYETVRYSDGNYIVHKGGKMGITDRMGRLATKLVYDTIYDFKEGVAIVGIGKREFISTQLV